MKITLPILLSVIVFSACGTRSQSQNVSADSTTVWVCGHVADSNSSYASYWINGQFHLLPPPVNQIETSFAEGIWVDKDDVYIAGFSPLGATLWKNGKPESIHLPLLSLTAVAAGNGNVYMTGNELDPTDGSREDGYLWINGQLMALPRPFGNAVASRLAVEGDDVYITGSIIRDTARQGTYAAYWKNGVATLLSQDTSTTQGIAIQHGDVYIAGALTGTQRTSALYWKNGVPVNLPSDSINSSATVIGVKDNNVFVAGIAFNRRLQIYNAVYWYKGVQHYLTAPDIESSAHCLVIHNGDVYIGGVIARPNATEGNKWQACYWKNGVLTLLPWPGGKGNLYVSGIFVTGPGR
jgi:hypothetical protein